MEATSMRSAAEHPSLLERFSWDILVTWILCFGLVAYLGIDGGGFDALVYNQVGIAIWWILLIGVLVKALPRVVPSKEALIAIGFLTAFLAWTALSLTWTESSERTMADVARVLTYLGIFALVLSTRSPLEARRTVTAVATAIALIAILALASRLHPAWIPSADQTARFLLDSRERLSYPLNYWNALGALVAIGLPLLLHLAAGLRLLAARCLAAAMLPPLGLVLFFTLSRGGIVAAALAIVVFIALTGDRLPKLLTLLVAGAGAGVLIGMTLSREALRHGLTNSTAHSQGDELLLVTIVVMIVVGLLQAAISFGFDPERRPSWTRFSRAASAAALGVLVLVVVVAGLAAHAPHRFSHAIDEFKGGSQAGHGTSRLGSFAGESRYALWKSALSENATDPLLGTGSGTFEYWWDRDASGTEAVRDTHSLYLQTLGELGIVGLAILVGFIVAIFAAGLRAVIRSDGAVRSALAAALAGALAFFVTAAVDWSWQMPVLPAAMFMLAGPLVMARRAEEGWAPVRLALPLRIVAAVAGLIAVVAIAIPLATTSLVRSSESEVRSGELVAALEDARSAQNVEPWAASPRLQEALVLEVQGELPAAAEAARAATERESTNWRTWLVLSRIEAERGRPEASIAAYRKAKSLYPLSPLFSG